MISLDMKSEAKTASISPLSITTPSDEPTLSFSELLRGVSDTKDDKVIQNGSLLLSLGVDETDTKDVKGMSKADILLGLLKTEDSLVVKGNDLPLQLNPELTQNLSIKDLKALVADAKNFLKDKIEASDDFKMSQIKELPKTLKGLVAVAKKYDIDISKITIEEVKIHVKLKAVKEDVKTLSNKDAIEKAPVLESSKNIKQDTSSHVRELLQDRDVKTKAVDVKDISTKKIDTDLKTNISTVKKEVVSQEVNTKATDVKEVAIKKADSDVKINIPTVKEVEIKDVKAKAVDVKIVENDIDEKLHVEEKIVSVKKEVKSTPLFKAQAPVEHTTEQIVQVKQFQVETKTPKEKADETLKLLLRGDKPSSQNPSLTTDFSVETAKVIAPRATTESNKALESLLRGDNTGADDGIEVVKTETGSVQNDDGFDAKLKEAKQMIKYLSGDVKMAIEDYKSPFTRVKVQLNPQRLGEVDLTVVSRGKNLHVTLSSNNAAINTLAMNVNDLKVQLSNSGINNASFNFNSNSGNDANANQQQQRHNEKEAHEEYNYIEQSEENEEILSSLEIVVPQYG